MNILERLDGCMKRHSALVLGLVGLMLLSGCATALSQVGDDSTPTGTAVEPTTTAAGTTTQQGTTQGPTTGTSTSSTTSTTATTTTGWSQPQPPNEPLQLKMEETGRNAIKSVDVRERATAEGAVELTVTANTSMPDIDPKSHGTVEGEPYILVYVDGHLATAEDSIFATPRGVLVSRTEQLPFDENGEFTVTVPGEAFDASGVEPGSKTELMVLVMDRDSDWDDIYGKEFVDVTYEPTG